MNCDGHGGHLELDVLADVQELYFEAGFIRGPALTELRRG
jgi:hypothetical protein